MELDDFLLRVKLKARESENLVRDFPPTLGISHRNAHYSIWSQKPIRQTEVSVLPEAVMTGFVLFGEEHLNQARQTHQRIFSPISEEDGKALLARFDRLGGERLEFLTALLKKAGADQSYSFIFVEDDTEKNRNKGVLVLSREAIVDNHIATIRAEVKCIHLEGSITNRAALIYSLFSQLKTDFLALQKSIETAQVHDLCIQLQVINEFGEDDTYNEAFALMPDWIEAEIQDDLTMDALSLRQW